MIRGDAEMRIEVVDLAAGAKAGHADEEPVRADELVPALAYRRLDRDADRRVADRLLAIGRVLLEEQFEGRHGDDARLAAILLELLARGERDLDLRARSEDRHLGLA